MGRLAYAAMLVFVLASTLPLDRLLGAEVLTRWRRAALAIAPVAAAFLAWDVAATQAGHWWFDPRQVLPVRVLGLPLEEVAFFVVVPLAALLTYEGVGAVLRRGALRAARHTKARHTHSGSDPRGEPPT